MAISNVHGGRLRITHDGRFYRVDTSVHELLELGKIPVGSTAYNARTAICRRDRFDNRENWYGMDLDRCLNLRDFPEGLELAAKYRKQLPALHAAGIKRVPTWSEEGDEFDRDRFDAGQDECWRSRRRASRIVNRPILKLTCEIGADCRKKADQLAWAGAVAFAVCDAAEDAGYQLEIDAMYHGEHVFESGEGVTYRIVCKQAGEPLDREHTILALACPAFFRWHFIQSLCTVCDNDCTGGFGTVADLPSRFHGELHIARCTSESDAKRESQRLMAHIAQLAEGVAA